MEFFLNIKKKKVPRREHIINYYHRRALTLIKSGEQEKLSELVRGFYGDYFHLKGVPTFNEIQNALKQHHLRKNILNESVMLLEELNTKMYSQEKIPKSDVQALAHHFVSVLKEF